MPYAGPLQCSLTWKYVCRQRQSMSPMDFASAPKWKFHTRHLHHHRPSASLRCLHPHPLFRRALDMEIIHAALPRWMFLWRYDCPTRRPEHFIFRFTRRWASALFGALSSRNFHLSAPIILKFLFTPSPITGRRVTFVEERAQVSLSPNKEPCFPAFVNCQFRLLIIWYLYFEPMERGKTGDAVCVVRWCLSISFVSQRNQNVCRK